eukprot:COSAG01_NODE_1180_length_11360_cov_40.643460_9_plen_148_part_00
MVPSTHAGDEGDPGLDGAALQRDGLLPEPQLRQRRPRGDHQPRVHEVDARHALRHGVLHLMPRRVQVQQPPGQENVSAGRGVLSIEPGVLSVERGKPCSFGTVGRGGGHLQTWVELQEEEGRAAIVERAWGGPFATQQLRGKNVGVT